MFCFLAYASVTSVNVALVMIEESKSYPLSYVAYACVSKVNSNLKENFLCIPKKLCVAGVETRL